MVSSGDNRNTLHVISLTGPTANGGAVFNGQDGAIVYTRSTNMGLAWSTPVVLPGLGSDYYRSFGSDVYEFAEPQGNNLAFAIVDNSNDVILMRSSDNGETWQKKVLWEHPYPMLEPCDNGNRYPVCT
ncbi:MAG: exo-alpha-sialidase [Bacteroidales bacterium]|nr:exo-alpha-sialidase [Bacteroidales bacterium]